MKKMTTISRLAGALIITLWACAPAPPPARAQPDSGSLFAAAPEQQWRLPGRLREISGLAASADGRLFGHDDEHAAIYEIDIQRGLLVKAFALGDPVQTGDFEGLAITPAGEFWLTTSEGRLYRFREGEDGGHAAFETFTSGVPASCNVEGLAFLPARTPAWTSAHGDSLILACKNSFRRGGDRQVALYIWSLAERRLELLLDLPAPLLARGAAEDDFHASSVEVDLRTGAIVLLAARERVLAEVSPEGAVLSSRQLSPLHVQAEGATIMPDGSLVIADEGAGGRALISRYARRL